MITNRTMEGFAAEAERSWRTLAPEEYSAIEDKPGFFRAKGEAALAAWEEAVGQLAFRPGVRGGTTLEEAGRIEAIRLQVDEVIRREYLEPPGWQDRVLTDPDDRITLRDFTPAVGRWVQVLRQVMAQNVGTYPTELEVHSVQEMDPVTGETVTMTEWDDDVYYRLEDMYGASQDAILDAMRTWADQYWQPGYDTPANRAAFDEMIPAHPRVNHQE